MTKDEKKIYQENWYQKNRDRLLLKGKKYYEDNKDICQEKIANYYQKNKKRIRQRRLEREYGVDKGCFEKMLKKQNGCCAICGLPEVSIHPKSKEKCPLNVDHNHHTGRVRGLLCKSCNLAIGFLRVDDFGILNLQTAIEYIKSYQNEKFDC